MANDPYFNLAYLAEGSPQAEQIFNEFVGRVSATMGRVKDRSLGTPPVAPALGDAYLIPSSGTAGDWVGSEGNLALWAGAWRYIVPKQGMRVYDEDTDVQIYHDGVEWTAVDGCKILTYAATINPDFSEANMLRIQLTGNLTLGPATGMRPGRTYSILFIQDVTGGRTVTYTSGAYQTDSGTATAPVVTTSGAKTLLVYIGAGCGEIGPIEYLRVPNVTPVP